MPSPLQQLDPRQERVIEQFASSNGLTREQAVSVLMAAGAKAFAADSQVTFSQSQALELQLAAQQSMQSMQALNGSLKSTSASSQAILKNIR
jgi:hypothetical protein